MNAATVMQMPPGRREFDFTMDDHRIIAKIAYSTAGILLPDSKTQMVYGRLAPRVRERGLKSVAEYLKLIDQDAAERERAIDALTTNHTSFFRESHHFDHFTAEVWPGLAQRLTKGGKVRLWSAACSSGEEPYTWLMSALGSKRDEAARLLKQNFKMLATDLSPTVLATARTGIYPAQTMETVPHELRRTWTRKDEQSLVVDPALRAAISFLPLNLLNDWPMRGQFDAICCRNVMIYFDGPSKERLQSRLADQLVTGGMMYIGHSERLEGPVAKRFEMIGRTAFRKIAA